VYTAILNGKFIKDGSYGMPHPDASPTSDFTLADIKQRVKIKKTANGGYFSHIDPPNRSY
jgi:hypothetical protein